MNPYLSLSNIHTHTHYSDGSSPPEDYVNEAIGKGFLSIGFSDHSPLPFENTFAIKEDRAEEYCETILKLKKKYTGKIEVLLGMEIDFIPDIAPAPSWFRQQYPLDFIIGSVHLVKHPATGERWFIDGPYQESYDKGLQKVFAGDIRAGVTAYYHQLMELIRVYKPDVVGHLDKIKMHNKGRYFSEEEPWYLKLVDETLLLMPDAGCRMEINTRGIYKKRSDTLFPGIEIIRKAHGLGIPVTLATDAHKPQELSLYLQESAGLVQQAGYASVDILTANGWIKTGTLLPTF